MTREADIQAVLAFKLGAQLCALPLAQTVETLRPLPIRPVAGAPSVVLGLSLIRGAALPVIDLAALFGRHSEQASRFIVAKTPARRFALLVDTVVGVQKIPRSALQDLPPLLQDADKHSVQNITRLDSELLFLLNSARLAPIDWWPEETAA